MDPLHHEVGLGSVVVHREDRRHRQARCACPLLPGGGLLQALPVGGLDRVATHDLLLDDDPVPVGPHGPILPVANTR